MSGGPKTIAEGLLSQTPLEHVLVSVDKRKLTGTLALWPEDGRRGQDRLLFHEGRIKAARLLDAASALDRGLLPLFGREKAAYAFYEKNLVGQGEGVLEGDLDPFALIAARLRGGSRADFVSRILDPLNGLALRMTGGVALERFEFIPKEKAVVDLLRAEPSTLDELARRSGDARRARRLVYLLRIAGVITPAGQNSAAEISGAHRTGAAPPISGAHESPPSARPRASNPPAKSTARPPARSKAPASQASTSGAHSSQSGAHRRDAELPPDPPATLSDELRERWREIADYVVEIDAQNFFEMLALGQDVSEEEVRDAYFRQVKRFHPDRLPPDLAPLVPFADRIFHHLTEARDTLGDARARIKYKATVQQGGGTPAADRQLALVVNAAMDFQKVEVLVRRRAWDEALTILEEALEVSPDEADYHAMRGWVLLERHGTKKKKDANEILTCAERALAQAPDHERALHTRAAALKQLDRMDEALKDFEHILVNNPKHVEATREIRLARMRGRKPGGKALGFFEKLFSSGKKKK
ncbi:MAG: DnaJ domain-containing protein [Deltaproteobacteria bacterium]|nr:DnaJ domain-containing protein [Deltaproteobacteria bacterium]